MAVYKILTPKKVTKRIHKLPHYVQLRLINHLDDLTVNPNRGLKLQGELNAYQKLRVGDYRIIFSVSHKAHIVKILKIEHRQGVYK